MGGSSPGVVVFGTGFGCFMYVRVLRNAGFADGVAALRVLEAARCSAREGRWIRTGGTYTDS